MRKSLMHGITLVEAMVTIAIVAVLASVAAPSFVETIARQRLEGGLNTIAIDLQYARSEAIRRRTNAALKIADDGRSYAVTYTPEGGAEQTIKTVEMPDNVTLTAGLTFQFDGLRGFAAAQTINATSTKTTATLRALTNGAGRVQVCSPGGTFNGYPSC